MRSSTAARVPGSPQDEGASHDAPIKSPFGPAIQSASIVVRLGRFDLLPAERLLLKDGASVSIGGRALDILIALSERPAELVGKADLIARVWPNRTVEEGNLRFHVAVLRKVLSAGCDDSRVICTVPGRGYQLVAETSFSVATQGLTVPSAAVIGARPTPVSSVGKGGLALISSRAACPQPGGVSGLHGDSRGLAEARTMPGVSERDNVLLFGPFELNRKARVLKKHGAPICLGGRALDLLIALIERPYEVVTKHELTDKVWPDRVVAEGNLRFQLSALRKALEDGKAGNRYITNVPGRGYCFVARVTPTDRGGAMPLSGLGDQACLGAPAARTANYQRMSIAAFTASGRTTVTRAMEDALAAAHSASLGSSGDPQIALKTIASAMGLDMDATRSLAALFVSLRERPRVPVPGGGEHLAAVTAA